MWTWLILQAPQGQTEAQTHVHEMTWPRWAVRIPGRLVQMNRPVTLGVPMPRQIRARGPDKAHPRNWAS